MITGSIHTDGYAVAEDIFGSITLRDLECSLRATEYKPFPLDRPQVLHLAPVPKLHDNILTNVAEVVIGGRVEQLQSFVRLNTGELDTHFRIHSDGRIYNKQPDYACVFYIDTRDDSGTAFYESSKHGRRPARGATNVYKEDDGTWREYAKVYQKRNHMLVYDARLFHGRFPWKSYGTDATDGRIVIVKFLKKAQV